LGIADIPTIAPPEALYLEKIKKGVFENEM
jgi:hypothetical protein